MTRFCKSPAWGFLGGSDGEASVCIVGDLGSIPGLRRSPGEGNGNPLQYSCLENFMDRTAWQGAVSPWGHKRVGYDRVTNTHTVLSTSMDQLT